MKMPRLRWLAVIGALGLSVLVIGFFAAGPHKAPKKTSSHARTVSKVNSTITIDPQVGMTFAPAPQGVKPALTAAEAWAKYARLNGDRNTAIPSNVTVTLGLLTLPIGPTGPNYSEAYTAHNELAYGYSSPSAGSGCVTLNPRLRPPPYARCIQWDFLDANTGKQIVSTWQKIGHWQWLINHNAP